MLRKLEGLPAATSAVATEYVLVFDGITMTLYVVEFIVIGSGGGGGVAAGKTPLHY